MAGTTSAPGATPIGLDDVEQTLVLALDQSSGKVPSVPASAESSGGTIPAEAHPITPAKFAESQAAIDAGPDSPNVGWRLKLALLLTVPLVGVAAIDVSVEGSPVESALGRIGFLALQAALCLPVVFLCGWPILTRAWGTIRRRQPGFYTLIGLGIGAALTFSLLALLYEFSDTSLFPTPTTSARIRAHVTGGLEAVAPTGAGTIEPFFEGVAVMVVLVLFGLSLEHRARSRTGEAIRKLIRLAPANAHVICPDGHEEDRPLGQVFAGDLVRVRPGERIPVDGLIREGSTTVDESLLTGEAMRTGRTPGTMVMAGTENGLGTISVETLRVNEHTSLAHIIELVGRALKARIPLQRTADRLAAWLIPLAILAATGTYAAWMLLGPPGSELVAGVCAIGVLVATCPVALGLAAPTAVVVSMRRAVRGGVLFRDGAALERLAGVDTVLFDKTGTLTEGRMNFLGVESNVTVTQEEVLAVASAVERGSLHPIGLAIVWEAARRNVLVATAEEVEEVPGKGMRGRVNGTRVAVGTLGFIQESGAHREPMLGSARTHRARGHNLVFVSQDTRCIGVIIMQDPIRAGAQATIDGLKAAGVRPVLVTGDHAETAKAVADMLGIEDVLAETLPAEKYAIVKSNQNKGRVVAMCGDGVNDAPALAAADVGIAMGTGTETAVSTAGVALAQPDLRALLLARKLSQSTVRTIRKNLYIAFAYTVIALPIAAGALIPFGGGLVSPVWQAALMAITSLLVVVNSERLR